MIGMYGLIQDIRTFQQRAYRLTNHAIVNSPALIFGTRIKTIAPPGIFLFFGTKRTERINIPRRSGNVSSTPALQEGKPLFVAFRNRIMNVDRSHGRYYNRHKESNWDGTSATPSHTFENLPATPFKSLAFVSARSRRVINTDYR